MSSSAFAYLFVDGYCLGGVDQRKLVTATSEGYRARELGFAYYTDKLRVSGSVYFHDRGVRPALSERAVCEKKLHGLPVNPHTRSYGHCLVLRSSQLLDALKSLHDVVAVETGRVFVFVYKGVMNVCGRARPFRVRELSIWGCSGVRASTTS